MQGLEIIPLVVATAVVSYLYHYEERRLVLHALPYVLMLASLLLFLWITGSAKLATWGPVSGLIGFMHLSTCWSLIFKR